MNVLQINTVYPGGSTGRITAEIAAYTAQQADAHALVAFGIGEEAKASRLTAYRIGSPLERKLHAIIRKIFDAEGYGSRCAARRLIRLCKQEHVDIVHLQNLHGCYLNLKILFRFLQKSNLPVIWTLHDCWPMTGHCAHFSYIGCERWKTLCRKCPQKKEYPVCIGISGSKRNYRLKKRLFTSLHNLTIVAPCRWMQGIAGQSFLGNYPIRVIYNGVDVSFFKPTASDIRERYGLESYKLLLAVASDWTERKGLYLLKELPKRLDDTYRLAIAGLTRAQIQALPANVIGIEHLSATELCAWYTAADCFVNPTLEDTMPLVNLEALACGTPIAVFDTGGCPEAVTADSGIVVEKGNIQGMADAVKNICESQTDYTQACIRQANRFSMHNTLKAYDALYREVMK